MSVIVAIKYKGGVLIGADKQSTCGNIASETEKIFKMEYSNTAIGSVGYTRDGNILSIMDEIVYFEDILKKTEIDKRYVIENIVPKLFDKYEKYNRIVKESEIKSFQSQFLFCTSKRIFKIDCDGAVLEYKNFLAKGCGEQLAQGYLENVNLDNITKEEAKNIIEKTILKSCEKDVYIGNKIDYIDLKVE